MTVFPSHDGSFDSVAVGTSQVTVVAPNSKRKSVVIVNNHATNVLYLGVGVTATVTTADGFPVVAGQSIEVSDYVGPIYGIASGADTDVRWLETGTRVLA